LRFHAKPFRGAESDVQLPDGPNANGTTWLVAPAKEQLALITENGFMSFPFVKGLNWRRASVTLRPRV